MRRSWTSRLGLLRRRVATVLLTAAVAGLLAAGTGTSRAEPPPTIALPSLAPQPLLPSGTEPVPRTPATMPSTPPAPGRPPPSATGATSPPPAKPALSAYGDSVLLGAAAPLRSATSHLDLDAAEGRPAYDVLDDIAADARAHRLTPDVLIHVGDNGPIDLGQLRATLRALTGHRVVLMTLRVPRDWPDPDNQIIRSVAAQFPYVSVVDWRRLSGGPKDWLYADGLHLTPDGAVAYTRLVIDALTQ